MPTYEYTCKQCGAGLEVFQSFADKPLRTHDGCGGELRKVFHARGIVFKGSGFYATDVRTSSPSGNGKSGGKPSTGEKKSEPVKTTASTGSSASDD